MNTKGKVGWLRVGGHESQCGHTSGCGRNSDMRHRGSESGAMGLKRKGESGSEKELSGLSPSLKVVRAVSNDSLSHLAS